jgi:hypothetical protein
VPDEHDLQRSSSKHSRNKSSRAKGLRRKQGMVDWCKSRRERCVLPLCADPCESGNASHMSTTDDPLPDSQMHCRFLAVGYWKSSTASEQLSLVPYPRVCSSISQSGLSISRLSIRHRLMRIPMWWLGQHRWRRDIMLTPKLAIYLPMSSLTERVLGYQSNFLVHRALAYLFP